MSHFLTDFDLLFTSFIYLLEFLPTVRREKRIVEEGYDKIAEEYAAARSKLDRRDKKYLDSLLERLPEGSRILDLGCGSGEPVTKFLAERHEVVGIDISRRQIQLAQENVPNATFFVGDMTETSFPDKTFDAIVSLIAIIHVPREEHADLFGRMHAMLKDGGLVLLTLGSDDWVSSPDDRFFGVRMYWSHYDSETSKRMLEKTGFRIIQSSIEGKEFHGHHEEHLYVLARRIDVSSEV